jgi:hypothetical protein
VLAVFDIGFFNTTNPSKTPSGLLIVGFVLVALSVYAVLRILLVLATIYGLPLAQHGRRQALFLGGVCAVLVALQSLGELTLRDVVVLVLLTLIAYLYTTYGRGAR